MSQDNTKFTGRLQTQQVIVECELNRKGRKSGLLNRGSKGKGLSTGRKKHEKKYTMNSWHVAKLITMQTLFIEFLFANYYSVKLFNGLSSHNVEIFHGQRFGVHSRMWFFHQSLIATKLEASKFSHNHKTIT